MWGGRSTSRPGRFTPGKSTQCIGVWVGPRAGLDRCGKPRPHRDSIPGRSSPYRIAIPTELSRPQIIQLFSVVFCEVRAVHTFDFRICMNVTTNGGPPLWSSGQSFWLQIQRSRVRFPALPDFLSSSGSGTGSTQPREVN